MSGPKISIAMTLAVMGVLAEPAKRATRPMAAKVAWSDPVIEAKKDPAVAPTKKIGVTMPPLPLKFKVKVVKIIFSKKAPEEMCCPAKQFSMVSKPSQDIVLRK